jgi:hypothetical protein
MVTVPCPPLVPFLPGCRYCVGSWLVPRLLWSSRAVIAPGLPLGIPHSRWASPRSHRACPLAVLWVLLSFCVPGITRYPGCCHCSQACRFDVKSVMNKNRTIETPPHSHRLPLSSHPLGRSPPHPPLVPNGRLVTLAPGPHSSQLFMPVSLLAFGTSPTQLPKLQKSIGIHNYARLF